MPNSEIQAVGKGKEAGPASCAAGTPKSLYLVVGSRFLPPFVQFPCSSTSISKHVALSSQACGFDFFFLHSSGKGMEAEVGRLGLCQPLL